jgi:hypothetical protein
LGGRGLFITTEPLEAASVFDRIDLRGELPAGFDVEIHVNDVLRGQQRASGGGLYEFRSVPLNRGSNVVRLVFHGPRGERREELRLIKVGAGQVPAGALRLTAGMVQQELPLVQLRPVPAEFRLASAGALRGTINLAHGVSERLTVLAGLGHFTPALLPAPARGLAALGLRTAVGGLAIQGDGAIDTGGGGALVLGLAGRLGPIATMLRHGQYRGGFVDEVALLLDGGRLARQSTDLRLDFDVPLGPLQRLPISLMANHARYADGGAQSIAGIRGSLALARGLVSGGIDLQHQHRQPRGSGGPQMNIMAEFDTNIARLWQVRASVAGNPGRSAAIGVVVDHRTTDGRGWRLGITHARGPIRDLVVQAGTSWRLPFGDLSVGAAWQARGNALRINLALATGLIFDPFARRYRGAAPGVTASGALAVRAVADDPASPQGRPVPGLGLRGGAVAARTNGQGQALITGLAPPRGRVAIDPDGVDDPWLAVPAGRIDVLARPGRVATHLVRLAALGHARLQVALALADGSRRPVAALGLILTSATGEVRRVVSQFDGTVDVADLKSGRWHVAVESGQAQRLGLELADAAALDVPAAGGILPDQAITVRRIAG